MLPEVVHGYAFRELRSREGEGGVRHQHLPAASGTHDPRRLMHVEARVEPTGDERRARMDPHPHANRLPLPVVVCERPLCLDRGNDGVTSVGKREVEGVALHLDLDAPSRGDRVTHQAPVVLEGPHVGLFA